MHRKFKKNRNNTIQWWFSCPWRGNSPPSATSRVGKNSNSDILKLERCLIPVQSNGEQASDDISSLPKKVTEKHFVWGDRPDKHVTTECSNYLHILYFNARSLYPKLDELYAQCDMEKPDVVCLTETWLCADITESERTIPRYKCIRYDQNRLVVGLQCLSQTNWNSKCKCVAAVDWNFCMYPFTM